VLESESRWASSSGEKSSGGAVCIGVVVLVGAAALETSVGFGDDIVGMGGRCGASDAWCSWVLVLVLIAVIAVFGK